MAWDDVCKPKNLGGLGICKIRDINKALLSRWLWQFGQEKEKNSLWRKVVTCKYGMINDWEVRFSSLPYGCSCWKVIMNNAGEFKEGIRFDMGSGLRI